MADYQKSKTLTAKTTADLGQTIQMVCVHVDGVDRWELQVVVPVKDDQGNDVTFVRHVTYTDLLVGDGVISAGEYATLQVVLAKILAEAIEQDGGFAVI